MSPNSVPYFGSSLPYWLHVPHAFEGRQLVVFAQLPLVPTLLMKNDYMSSEYRNEFSSNLMKSVLQITNAFSPPVHHGGEQHHRKLASFQNKDMPVTSTIWLEILLNILKLINRLPLTRETWFFQSYLAMDEEEITAKKARVKAVTIAFS